METTLKQNWEAYMAAYNASSEAECERLLQQAVADDVFFTNPGGEGRTRAGLEAHIKKFHQMMPGKTFRTDSVLVHHGELMAVWSMHKEDGAKMAAGYNFVRTDSDGKFSYMAGFF